MTGPFVIVGVVAVGYCAFCLWELVVRVKQWREQDAARRQWLAERAKYRAELCAKGYAVLPAHVDPSSLLDDSPAPLPETWRAPCGEPIRFPSTNDRGSNAA